MNAVLLADLGDLAGALGNAAAHSPHNQSLDIHFTAGPVRILLFLVLQLSLITRTRGNLSVLCLVLIPVWANGITERPWAVGSSDFLTFSYLAALLVTVSSTDHNEQFSQSASRRKRPRYTAPAPSAHRTGCLPRDNPSGRRTLKRIPVQI